MPDTTMLAIWPLGLSVVFTALMSRTSPLVTVRFADMTDSEMPLESRRSVSFEGVRATAREH